jgi:hypothetical protein
LRRWNLKFFIRGSIQKFFIVCGVRDGRVRLLEYNGRDR